MNDLIDEDFGLYKTQSGHPASVLYLLDLAQQRLSSLAVDKIYGILGLAMESNGQTKLRIQPDYSQRTAVVYQQAAWSVIDSRADLEILDYVRHWTHGGQLEATDFDSWVPKWHRSKDMEEHSHFLSLSFDACLGRKAVIVDLDNALRSSSKTLTVRGLSVGTVASTSKRIKCDEDVRPGYLKTILEEAEAKLKRNKPEYGDGRSKESESYLVLTFCAGVDSGYAPADQDFVQSFREFRDGSPADVAVRSPDESGTTPHTPLATRAGQYIEAMYNACMNRKFFSTSNGYSGLGPHFMREGDEVVVLYGLRWPAVLRPLAGEGDRRYFMFLGTSYCHDIMHGEAVEKHEQLGAGTLDVFHVR